MIANVKGKEKKISYKLATNWNAAIVHPSRYQ